LTSPDRGQGLNHCIADIFNLLTALTSLSPTTSLADAITAYDAELVKRGSDEVETSRKNALLVHDFERFMESPVLKQGYAKAKARKEEEAKKAAEGENGAVNEAV
jgi:2-polyprenyl-6-methoxyphenol hydroxylase-like FAD-dependent oxidoreductase